MTEPYSQSTFPSTTNTATATARRPPDKAFFRGTIERIGQPNQAKCANHQDTDTGAKISAIDCYEKQEHTGRDLERN